MDSPQPSELVKLQEMTPVKENGRRCSTSVSLPYLPCRLTGTHPHFCSLIPDQPVPLLLIFTKYDVLSASTAAKYFPWSSGTTLRVSTQKSARHLEKMCPPVYPSSSIKSIGSSSIINHRTLLSYTLKRTLLLGDSGSEIHAIALCSTAIYCLTSRPSAFVPSTIGVYRGYGQS